MKKLLFALFMVVGIGSFAQQQPTRTRYYYTILNVENEQLVQQTVDEISTYKGVSACKYRIKPEKKTAEISFIFDEQNVKGESAGKTNSLPDIKKLILDKGLHYNSFTYQTEKITN